VTKHTPGPWRVDFNKYDSQWRVYTDGEQSHPVINSLFKPTGYQGEADARLIAAAPQLLEALLAAREKLKIECGREYKGGMATQFLFPLIDAAIAKATER